MFSAIIQNVDGHHRNSGIIRSSKENIMERGITLTKISFDENVIEMKTTMCEGTSQPFVIFLA